MKPLIGAVSGNLHLHISDLYYKQHIIMREKKANLDIEHTEFEGDQVKVLIDSRSTRAASFVTFNKANLEALIKKTEEEELTLESEIELLINHPSMVMFLLVKNTTRLVHDHLILPKLKDINPFDNGSIIDLGG